MYVIDTDILIDYIRLHAPALNFLDRLSKKERVISIFSQFELLKGCANKEQEVRINRFLKQFVISHLSEKIGKLALGLFRKYRWSFGLGMVDSFIAATAIDHQLQLVTRNTKHYQNIPSLKIHSPY